MHAILDVGHERRAYAYEGHKTYGMGLPPFVQRKKREGIKKMAQQNGASSGVPQENTLNRTLKLSDLITYGLIFMIPVAPVAFYGSQVGGAHGPVATAYVIGLIAMLFAIFSYAALPVPLR